MSELTRYVTELGEKAKEAETLRQSVKEYKELCDEELVKNELRWGRKRVVTDRVNIMVGTGTTRCEGLTTEWNDRILKRFEVFCSNCKLKKEEKREEKEAMKKAKADIVFSI